VLAEASNALLIFSVIQSSSVERLNINACCLALIPQADD